VLKRITSLFRRRQLDRDLFEELEAHFAIKQFHLEQQGVPPREAARQARLALGNCTLWQESTRREWTLPTLESLLQDISYGFRLLNKDRAFTIVVLTTLTLGIGANTAIFQLLNALLWSPLPIDQPNRLIRIRATNLPSTDRAWTGGRATSPVERQQVPYPLYQLLAARTDLFAVTAAILGQGEFATEIDNAPHRLHASVISGSYFSVLGLKSVQGRLLTPSDDIQGGPPEGWSVVISHNIWTRLFNKSPKAVGALINIERVPYRVLGVAPPNFDGIHPGVAVELWLPMSSFESLYPKWNWRNNPSQWSTRPFARLRPGVSMEQARNTLHLISPSLLAEVKDTQLSGIDLKRHLSIQLDPVSARNGFSPIANSYGPVLLLLLGAAAAVLLLAITNLTNLLLARGSVRQSEIAVRLALGASHGRVRRQLIAETLLLAVTGAFLSILFARWATQALLTAVSRDNIRITLATDFDWQALAFLARLSQFAGIFGYFWFKTAPKCNDCSEAISKRAMR